MTDWGRADLKEHATKQFCKLQPFVRKVLVMLWLMSCCQRCQQLCVDIHANIHVVNAIPWSWRTLEHESDWSCQQFRGWGLLRDQPLYSKGVTWLVVCVCYPCFNWKYKSHLNIFEIAHDNLEVGNKLVLVLTIFPDVFTAAVVPRRRVVNVFTLRLIDRLARCTA